MVCETSIPDKGTIVLQSHRLSTATLNIRLQFCKYLNSETGSVSWQYKHTAQMILMILFLQ